MQAQFNNDYEYLIEQTIKHTILIYMVNVYVMYLICEQFVKMTPSRATLSCLRKLIINVHYHCRETRKSFSNTLTQTHISYRISSQSYR